MVWYSGFIDDNLDLLAGYRGILKILKINRDKIKNNNLLGSKEACSDTILYEVVSRL